MDQSDEYFIFIFGVSLISPLYSMIIFIPIKLFGLLLLVIHHLLLIRYKLKVCETYAVLNV